MELDLELYRYSVTVSENPRVRLSVIDIAPEKPENTIVLIHGFGGNTTHWIYQYEAFSRDNRVIGVDLRGHGQSDAPRGKYEMATLVADLHAVIRHLGLDDPFILAGHSFGGAIACEYAHAYPDELSHLILVASAGEYRLKLPERTGLSLPYPLLRAIQPLIRRWLYAPIHVLQSFYRNTLSTWNGWHLMRDIRTPTLVIRGHHDRVFSSSVFTEVPRVIPNAEDVDVGASGHMVMLERREAVNRAIKRFIEATPKTWRETHRQEGESSRANLVRERPWLKHYDQNVPFTVAAPHVPLQQLLRSAARRFPLKTAVNFYGHRITYRRLNHEVNRFANAIRSLGIERGDRVMMLIPNSPQFLIGFFGILKAGAIAVLSPPGTSVESLEEQAQEAGIKLLFLTADQLDLGQRLVKQVDSLSHLIITDRSEYISAIKRIRLRVVKYPAITDLEPIHRLQKLIYSHSKLSPRLQIEPDDPAAIIFTGGTTSEPKGVVLSHKNLVANTLQTRHWMPELNAGKERFLCVIPFAHSYGLTAALNTGISLGATLILLDGFKPEEVLRTIKRYKPTIFPGVPNMYVAISNFPGVRQYGVQSINACISGSAPLAVETQERFEKLTRGRLVEGYGLTEAAPITHANPFEGLRKVGSIGIPLPSTEAVILDIKKGKKPVLQGQIGELAVRGPQVMLGYWNDQKGTSKVISPDGWLLTGDIAQMDADGYFRIIARKADMWYSSRPDEPAFPRDVEEVLFEIPQVQEAAVVGIAGKPIAFLITNEDRPDSGEIIAYCRRRLPPELVPIFVLFLDDFPRTFIGKVLRRELANRYREHIARGNS